MVAYSYGIIGWECSLIGLKSMKVSSFFLGGFSVFVKILLGPVRAVSIHPSRALLVSGADDYKIKVWGQSALSYLFPLVSRTVA